MDAATRWYKLIAHIHGQLAFFAVYFYTELSNQLFEILPLCVFATPTAALSSLFPSYIHI